MSALGGGSEGKGTGPQPESVGRALKRVFRQQDLLKGVEEPPASVSHLMNGTRRRVFAHLCSNPCDHVRGVSRALKLSVTGVNWQLGVLHRAGYLDRADIGRKLVYWPRGMVLKPDIRTVTMLRRPLVLDILALVHDSGGARERDLVRAIGESQQRVNALIGDMVGAKLLTRKGRGRGSVLLISERLEHMTQKYQGRSKAFSEKMLALLEKDGLMPKRRVLRGTMLSVQIKLPGGKERLRLECNALADIARLLRGR